MTVNIQGVATLGPSLAVYCTVVTPSLKVCPLAFPVPVPVVAPVNVQARLAGPQLSVVVASIPLTTAEQIPGSTLTTVFPGQVSVGASVSTTVTVNVQGVALFPFPSFSGHIEQ